VPLVATEKAYIAGIVDGEGSIMLIRHHRNETHSPTVSIANNDLHLLKWIKERTGGTLVSKRKRKKHHDSSYMLTIRQDRAIRFLKEIQPYLIIKQPQARLIVEEYKNVTHRAGKYDPDMLLRKNALVRKIRLLNQR